MSLRVENAKSREKYIKRRGNHCLCEVENAGVGKGYTDLGDACMHWGNSSPGPRNSPLRYFGTNVKISTLTFIVLGGGGCRMERFDIKKQHLGIRGVCIIVGSCHRVAFSAGIQRMESGSAGPLRHGLGIRRMLSC